LTVRNPCRLPAIGGHTIGNIGTFNLAGGGSLKTKDNINCFHDIKDVDDTITAASITTGTTNTILGIDVTTGSEADFTR